MTHHGDGDRHGNDDDDNAHACLGMNENMYVGVACLVLW